MGGLIFKFFGVAAILLIVFYQAGQAFRNARKLDARIEKHRKEMEERKKLGTKQDPYSELAEVYAERNLTNRKP